MLHLLIMRATYPANIYLFRINNRNTKKRYKTYLKFLLLTLNIFRTFFRCFYCWLWTSKCCWVQNIAHSLLIFFWKVFAMPSTKLDFRAAQKSFIWEYKFNNCWFWLNYQQVICKFLDKTNILTCHRCNC